METDVIDEIIEKDVSKKLESLAINDGWVSGFAGYKKTGEKELTLMIRIYQQSVDTDKCLEKIKEILKSMGWTYKIDEKVKDAGWVSR